MFVIMGKRKKKFSVWGEEGIVGSGKRKKKGGATSIDIRKEGRKGAHRLFGKKGNSSLDLGWEKGEGGRNILPT